MYDVSIHNVEQREILHYYFKTNLKVKKEKGEYVHFYKLKVV